MSEQRGQLREIKAADASSQTEERIITSEAGIRLLGASFCLLLFLSLAFTCCLTEAALVNFRKSPPVGSASSSATG